MNILQDILGLITKGKVKPPTGKDYMVVASYTDAQEILKPQPKMQANLVSLAALKNYIASSIAPPAYKIYTALLNQNGGDSILEFTGGDIVIGVTYEIYEASGGAEGFDFTNVGAPNNNIGTFFVATGITPNSWGNNNVGLRYNEGAPVVTVLENTIGNIWFTYNSVGAYSVTLANVGFQQNDTALFLSNSSNSQNGIVWTYVDGGGTISIETADLSGNYGDGYLALNTLEIRVYN